jgi:hypothetical protein
VAQLEQDAQAAWVAYHLRPRDAFGAVGIDFAAYGGRSGAGARASTTQVEFFRRAGLPTAPVAQLAAREAEALREALLERKAVGLCSPKQAAQLVALGIDPRNLYADEARELLRERKARRARAEGQ